MPKKTKVVPDARISEAADMAEMKQELSTQADQIFFIKWLQVGILTVFFLALIGWFSESIYRSKESHDRFFEVLTEYERLEEMNKKAESLNDQLESHQKQVDELDIRIQSLKIKE